MRESSKTGIQRRLLTDIWNDIEDGKPITWEEANRLKSSIDRLSEQYGREKVINWSQVTLK